MRGTSYLDAVDAIQWYAPIALVLLAVFVSSGFAIARRIMPPTCKTCAGLRTTPRPRDLKVMPFQTEHKGLPVLVCEFCDGPAFELASQRYRQQTKRKKRQDS